VLELYRTEEAFKAHVASDHFQAFRPKMAALIAAPPEVERLDVVI
jgi:quinol monooxygenase YgiN